MGTDVPQQTYNDAQKKQQIQDLTAALSEKNFLEEQADKWLKRLPDIFADNYRMAYADVFAALQMVLDSNNHDQQDTTISNVEEFLKKAETQFGKDATAYRGAKKISDHVNLEISRYQYYRQLISTCTGNNKGQSPDAPRKEHVPETDAGPLNEINNLKEQFAKTKEAAQIAEQKSQSAAAAMEKLDDRLDRNNISSITMFSVFSAVIITFVGSISFTSSVLQGMDSVSKYRLILVIALTGLVLVNAVFLLLYMAARLTGKSIAASCGYWAERKVDESPSRRMICGAGFCRKPCARASGMCRLVRHYPYIIGLNSVFVGFICLDVILWICENGSTNGIRSERVKRVLVAAVVLAIICVICAAVIALVVRKLQRKRAQIRAVLEIAADQMVQESLESGNFFENTIRNLADAVQKAVLQQSQNEWESCMDRMQRPIYQPPKEQVEQYIAWLEREADRRVSDGALQYPHITHREATADRKNRDEFYRKLRKNDEAEDVKQ